MIRLKNLRKTYGRHEAVRGLDLEVAKGEFLALVGESGCGKTTTLKMINRLVERTSGEIEVDGQDVASVEPAQLRRNIGYVFQGVGLFPHMTISQNVGVVPRLLGWDEQTTAERTHELMGLLQLPSETYGQRFPRQLSGGQRQRIGLARALAARPKIVLMDEPFGAVDPINRDHLQVEFRKIHDEAGVTSVMVTHDITEALLMADRVAIMLDGQLLQIGSPAAVLNQPAHEYVERLMETPRRHASVLARLAGAGASRQ